MYLFVLTITYYKKDVKILQLQKEGCPTSCKEKIYKYFNSKLLGLMEKQEETLPIVCKSKSTCKGCRYISEDLDIKWCTNEFI